jgi:hypothetical protein
VCCVLFSWERESGIEMCAGLLGTSVFIKD